MPDFPTVYFHDGDAHFPPGFVSGWSHGFAALGVLMTALSLKADDPDGYVVDAEQLAGFSTDSPAETASIIEELRGLGYVTEDNRLAIPVVNGEPPRLRVVKP